MINAGGVRCDARDNVHELYSNRQSKSKDGEVFGDSLVVEKQQMEKFHVQPDQGPVCLLTWQSDVGCCSALSLDVLSLT
jgi:hypothetical protein